MRGASVQAGRGSFTIIAMLNNEVLQPNHEEPETFGTPICGRGATTNPANRFEKIGYEPDGGETDSPPHSPATEFLRDTSRSLITYNDSPDVGFEASINPYRGCEHGCIYCYARPTHEYLGFSAGLDFETRILVKEDAPGLLQKQLSLPSWTPQVIAISGVTDPYQPIERRLRLTRACLEVLAEFRNPVVIITKSHLVARDLDLLAELARYDAAAVFLSVTSLDGSLSRKLEPRASQPELRLAAIQTLVEASVPAGVLIAPVIPGLTDHEMPSILHASAKAGAKYAGYVMLRLPHGVSALFEGWLRQHFPDRREKILNRIRSIRGGKLNDPRFQKRMSGEGAFADQVHLLFKASSRKVGLQGRSPQLSTAAFRRVGESQLQLFA
ncbi:MAG: PA0069 family radical SAM protein [Acidobacteria bacterium]|nr:PA0069 family radical SAM protein [Acidobacteriota bacterium]